MVSDPLPTFSGSDLMRVPDLLQVEPVDSEIPDEERDVLARLIREAFAQMIEMRKREGETLHADIALRGSADVEVNGHRHPLDVDHIVRVGPTARRKLLPGPDGIRLLAIGGVPGQAYDPGSTL